MFKQILIVCIGNICRSPMAEKLFRKRLSQSDIRVNSAGLAAIHGNPMDTVAAEVLRDHGVGETEHVARQLDEGMIRTAEVLLVMEKNHLQTIRDYAPQAYGKTFLLGRWSGDLEIADPYRQPRQAFEHAHLLIEQAVEHWHMRLRSAQDGLVP